jgi:hypothetical protein
MRLAALACAAQVLVALDFSSARAVPFFADFETGVSRSESGGTWTKFPGGTEYLLGDHSHNHTPGGSQSARAYEANPWIYNSYADFGTTAGSLRATVYLFEDKNYVPPYQFPYIKVTNMFSLWGDSGSGPAANTDYLQIGIVPWFPGGGTTYGIRTKYNDDHGLGYIDTGVERKKSQWMKLTIEADSMASGGQVRYFIDDMQVGASQRSGSSLRWVMLGGTAYSYENFWYDDVAVVSTAIPGDFDSNGDVDGADFVAWQTHFPLPSGATLADGDADADGDVDGADFVVWQTHFPFTPGPSASPAPEPQSLLTAAIGSAITIAARLRHRTIT